MGEFLGGDVDVGPTVQQVLHLAFGQHGFARHRAGVALLAQVEHHRTGRARLRGAVDADGLGRTAQVLEGDLPGEGQGIEIEVKIGDTGAMAMGVVTRENFRDLPFGAEMNDKIAVYFPFSYGLGGYTLLIPRSSITEVNLPIERAMSLAITGWVKADVRKSDRSSDS